MKIKKNGGNKEKGSDFHDNILFLL